MEREIKFRGKRLNNGEWVVGDLIHKNNGDVAIRTYLNVWVENSDDIQSKVLAFAFGLSAEIERNLISQRTKEALARLKKEGHQVGRGQGQRNKQLNAKCVAKHKYIEGQMAKGISVPQIAKKLKIARGTLYRYLAYTGLRTPTKSRNGRWERGIY